MTIHSHQLLAYPTGDYTSMSLTGRVFGWGQNVPRLHLPRQWEPRAHRALWWLWGIPCAPPGNPSNPSPKPLACVLGVCTAPSSKSGCWNSETQISAFQSEFWWTLAWGSSDFQWFINHGSDSYSSAFAMKWGSKHLSLCNAQGKGGLVTPASISFILELYPPQKALMLSNNAADRN